ncbi:hypothetical protein ONZ51_g10642 [Trametes cubensis]|uniref:Uncharacterized protein n=1 Tax=Trametes cubensis TaxID=1111947 RepID=A0AAD7TJ44_9APHY|nr:hypothetical protein ONZ51_g10642 [Trametes cubensis]
MSRSELVQAGLNAILKNLSGLDQQYFEASSIRLRHPFVLDESHKALVSKEGFTSSGYRNIYYSITFTKDNIDTGVVLSLYVRNPSTDDPSANRKAFASAIEYFLSTGSTITLRDVDANDFRDL